MTMCCPEQSLDTSLELIYNDQDFFGTAGMGQRLAAEDEPVTVNLLYARFLRGGGGGISS